MVRRAIVLGLAGIFVGPLLDRMHLATGAIAYDTDVTPLGVPWWVHLVYLGAALGIGMSHPAIDKALRRKQLVSLGAGTLVLGFVGLVAIWAASGLIPASNGVIAATLALASAGVWWAFDRTWQGVVLAVATAVGGAVVEVVLVRAGLFHHARPDVMGIPVWLPFLYVAGSVAIGNLARRLSERYG